MNETVGSAEESIGVWSAPTAPMKHKGKWKWWAVNRQAAMAEGTVKSAVCQLQTVVELNLPELQDIAIAGDRLAGPQHRFQGKETLDYESDEDV